LKAVFLLLASGCLLCGSCAGGEESSQAGGRAVEIVLESVTVRQYRRQMRRFEFEARKLELDEETGVLKAPQGVWGRIEAEAFPSSGENER
jgi:hypothetical protein